MLYIGRSTPFSLYFYNSSLIIFSS